MEPIIWRVEFFEDLDSTNRWLSERAREGAPEGLVALADHQSAGRGRLGRIWSAPPGTALLCSVLLRPTLSESDVQLSVMVVALAIRSALVRLCGLRPNIKWPNDLVVGEKKLAGILAELVAGPDATGVVVGFGVNLTTHPDDVNATDVRHEAGVTLTSRALLDIVLEELEPRRRELDSAEGRERLRAEYERALVTLGRRVRVEQTGTTLQGVAVGVDERGALEIDVEDERVTVTLGDVVHLRYDEGVGT